MSRPLIGVTKGRGRGWALWAFAALSLRLQGARPVKIVPPFSRHAFERLDGLLIGGGDDIGRRSTTPSPPLTCGWTPSGTRWS